MFGNFVLQPFSEVFLKRRKKKRLDKNLYNKPILLNFKIKRKCNKEVKKYSIADLEDPFKKKHKHKKH